MASKAICAGVGIPMIIVGALVALLVPPAAGTLSGTAEFVGSLIGTIGAVFLVAGLFYTKEPVTH